MHGHDEQADAFVHDGAGVLHMGELAAVGLQENRGITELGDLVKYLEKVTANGGLATVDVDRLVSLVRVVAQEPGDPLAGDRVLLDMRGVDDAEGALAVADVGQVNAQGLHGYPSKS